MIIAISLPLLGYLIGSLSLSPLIARLRGVELSGSTGAANVARRAGVGWGVMSGGFDFAKGLLPVVIAKELGVGEWSAALTGVAAVCGHIWPLYYGFHGGRGLNTITGATAFLLPRELAFAFPLAIVVGYLVRGVAPLRAKVDPIPAGAAGGMIGLMLLAWAFREPASLISYGIMIGILPVLSGFSDLMSFIASVKRG